MLYVFGCGILKMVDPKMQDFYPRFNMLKAIFVKQSYDELKSSKIVLSKSILYVCQKSTEFFQKKKKSFKNINAGF